MHMKYYSYKITFNLKNKKKNKNKSVIQNGIITLLYYILRWINIINVETIIVYCKIGIDFTSKENYCTTVRLCYICIPVKCLLERCTTYLLRVMLSKDALKKLFASPWEHRDLCRKERWLCGKKSPLRLLYNLPDDLCQNK